MQFLTKSRHWTIALGLLALVLVAVAGMVLTRQSATESAQISGRHAPIVDETPLHTARAMAALASSREEQRYAQQALRLADHEVDLAFAYEMRYATQHPAPPTPETKELYARVNRATAQVKSDQELIDELKKSLPANGPPSDELQQQLDLVQAQMELDEDELEDAKGDLIRSGVDRLSRIQRQFARYQAAQSQSDANRQPFPVLVADTAPAAVNLVAQATTWRTLRSKVLQLQQAHDEALQKAGTLQQNHDTLEKQIGSESGAQPSQEMESATNSSQAVIASLRRLSGDQKDLSDLDKRIQDHQELSTVYNNWIAFAQLQQRAALHGVIRSAFWILLIVLVVYLIGRAIDHFLPEALQELTRMRTLRLILRFAVQVVGLLLILLVVFGAPNQTPTIIGLATAGITVAMKDFIVAFVGWFVLIGRNGIRVGDWVEINGVVGEVTEISLWRTVLLETGNWTDTGHPTGRKVAFMNSFAIEGHFFNFSTAGQWLWDELEIMVPASDDPYPIIEAIQKIVAKETEPNVRMAEQEWQRAAGRSPSRSISAAPAINLRPTPAGVEVHVRYITRANERFAMRSRLNQAMVDLFHHRGVPQQSPVEQSA